MAARCGLFSCLVLFDVFVCLFVLFDGPVNTMGIMSSAVSVPNHTFTGQA